jgi:hypothetical protein
MCKDTPIDGTCPNNKFETSKVIQENGPTNNWPIDLHFLHAFKILNESP